MNKSSWQQLPGILEGFFREGGELRLRSLFLVQSPALCHDSKKVFRMNKYLGQIQALFLTVSSNDTAGTFHELRSPLCALENTNCPLPLSSFLPLTAQDGEHPKARGWVFLKEGCLQPCQDNSVASVLPASPPTPHFLGPGTPKEEQRARKGESA